MAWLTRGCERCGNTSADVRCDACAEPMCCGCAVMLGVAITDSKGNLYLHMCPECATLINDDLTIYEGPRLVIDNTRQGGKV
jgi:hypothetical protein